MTVAKELAPERYESNTGRRKKEKRKIAKFSLLYKLPNVKSWVPNTAHEPMQISSSPLLSRRPTARCPHTARYGFKLGVKKKIFERG